MNTMKLNVDFSELMLATSQMHGLKSLAEQLLKQAADMDQAVKIIELFSHANNGTITYGSDHQIVVVVGDEKITVFAAVEGGTKFYFES